MSKAAKPVLIEASVSYSGAVKANLGDFENADLTVTEAEKWDVSKMSESLAEAWLADRYDVLKERVDARIVEFYTEQSKNCR